ncbi:MULTISPECIES: hypothetical protein, partial [unclassified Bacteroides]|uniref:hypothetical protein n=1 Tax=unclassified Bacteroides TaxID=2646097 RepID=UPI00054FEDF7
SQLLYFFVYVNLSMNSFLFSLSFTSRWPWRLASFPKASAKIPPFSELPNFSERKIQNIAKFMQIK